MKSKILTYLLSFWTACICFSQNTFTEVSQMAGMDATPGSESIAVGDFNNDGYEDLYVGFPNKKNQLWKNTGNGTFTEVAESAGVALAVNSDTKTAVWGDIDNDGWLDLYVGNKQQPDKLFHNNGDPTGTGVTFTEISLSAGIFQLGHPQSVNMADVNNDGFLDIYVSNFLQQNVLYQNNGNLTFTDKTFQSGAIDQGKAMGSIFFDYDKDGDVDLYLVHDNFEPNFLYQNDGTGHFTEVGAATGANTMSFGMGVDVGDINNDGWPDIYITNLNKNFLLLNNGNGTFFNISATAAIEDPGMGWGVSILDFDNDGWQDVYVANDYAFSPKPNVLYRNLGNNSFEKAEASDPICNLMASYGTACFDYDLDGNMDLAVANRGENQHLQLFQNADRPGNWLGIKLIGVQSNRQAIGAKIRILDGNGILHYDELTAGSGWTSQNSSIFHFGLGNADAIQEMTVLWPSGFTQAINPLELGKYYTLSEGRAPTEGISFDTTTTTGQVLSEDELDVRISPNPSDGRFSIKFDCKKSVPHLIKISNQQGKLVFEKKLDNPAIGEHVIDFEPGTFSAAQMLFIAVSNEGRTTVKKVVLR